MVQVWWCAVSSLALIVMTAADVNNSSGQHRVVSKATFPQFTGPTSVPHSRENLASTNPHPLIPGHREHYELPSRSGVSPITDDGDLSTNYLHTQEGIDLAQQPVANTPPNTPGYVERTGKMPEFPCTRFLREEHSTRQSHHLARDPEQRQRQRSRVLEIGATDSADKSNVERNLPVTLLVSTSDEAKTLFFIQDIVFKLMTKATFRQNVFTEERKSIRVGLHPNPHVTTENDVTRESDSGVPTPDDSSTEPRASDIEDQVGTTIHPDALAIIPGKKHPHDSSTTLLTTIPIKDIPRDVTSSAGVEETQTSVPHKTNSSYFKGAVELAINEVDGESTAGAQIGKDHSETNLEVPSRQITSKNSTRAAAKGKSIDDVLIFKPRDQPIQVNVLVPSFQDNITIVDSIEPPVKTNISKSQDVVIVNLKRGPDYLAVSSTDPLLERTAPDTSRGDVKTSPPHDPSAANESDTVPLLATTVGPRTPEAPTEAEASSPESSPTATGSVGLNQRGSDNIQQAATNMSEVVVIAGPEDDEIVEIDGIDIPAIDYDALTDESNTESNADFDSSDMDRNARSMIAAPRRTNKNGRYVNGRFRPFA